MWSWCGIGGGGWDIFIIFLYRNIKNIWPGRAMYREKRVYLHSENSKNKTLMDTNKVIKISSITKKLLVALFGAFLLVFLLFHMCANLFILAKDGGDAYGAFCHFMGTNIIIKVFELVLFGTFLLHICLSCWLWWQNRKNRPVRYHQKAPSWPSSRAACC